MRTIKLGLITAILVLATLACGITNGVSNLVSGKNTVMVSDLWPDVPRMDGFNKVNVDLPLAARVAIQGFESASSHAGGDWNFIAFETTTSAKGVSDYYTMDRMKQAGWNLTDTSGCTGQIVQATPSGGEVCFFGRQESQASNAFLVIFVTRDEKTSKTQVFFVRLVAKIEATPTP